MVGTTLKYINLVQTSSIELFFIHKILKLLRIKGHQRNLFTFKLEESPDHYATFYI